MATLKPDDVERLARELAGLARANIPLGDGLRELSRSLGGGRLKELTDSLAAATQQGKPLSEGLAAAGVKTPPEFAAILRCGERTGDLDGILDFSVDHARRARRHRAAVATAMVYPVAVLIVLVCVILFLANGPIINLDRSLASAGPESAGIHSAALTVALVFQGWTGAGAAAALAALILVAFRYMTRLPGIAPLVALSDTAIAMQFLAQMLKRGVPIQEALRAAALAVWSARTRQSLNAMAGAAERGLPVAPLLSPDTPSMAAYLFSEGEKRGDLDRGCADIASYCEDRFDRTSKRALAMIEPALVLFVGLVVGLTLAAMYHPLFTLARLIGR